MDIRKSVGLLCLALKAVLGGFNCSKPFTFSCSESMVRQLSNTPAAQWYTLTHGGSSEYATDWAQAQASCCRHCIWDLGYPFANPIALASDRTVNADPKYLDCIGFQDEFYALDLRSPRNMLTYGEALPYLTGGINGYLASQKILNVTLLFKQADFNRDQVLSLQEWLVLRHFWAPIHLASVGPRYTNNNGQVTELQSGPLGGFYWDQNLIEVFVNDATNVILAQCCSQNCSCNGPSTTLKCVPWVYPPCPTNTSENFTFTYACQMPSCNSSNLAACSSARTFLRSDGSTYVILNYVDPCDANCRWDSSFVRVFTAGEENRVMTSWDLDGSGRISIEEHYFRVFADQTNDGKLTRAEYDSSLYPDGAFDSTDLNSDGFITFVERKYTAASTLPITSRRGHVAVGGLSRNEWMFSDLPADYGTFDAHAVLEGSTMIVQPLGFSYYAILFQCAMQAQKLYQIPLSQYPWISTCPLVVYGQDAGPWMDISSQDGYLLQMWSIIASRLMWNSQLNGSAVNSTLQAFLKPPPISGQEYGVMSIGLFASWGKLNSSQYLCSRSFAPSLDGLVVIVLTNPPSFSLILAILQLIPGYSFINLVSFLIVVLFAAGHVVWFLERKENPDQFDPKYFKGLLDSAWFLMVAMSTVGYGDKVPASGGGKALAFFWLFFGVLIFSVFLGNVMSSLNLQIAEASIDGPSTLSGFTVGIYSDSLTRSLTLDSTFQFNPSYCQNMKHCIEQLVNHHNVSALLVPYVEVLTYMVDENLGGQSCGSPVRIVGDPIYGDKLPAARLCLFGELLYAARYLLGGVQTQLDLLDAEGTSASLQNVLLQQLNQESAGCIVNQYDLNMISGAVATVTLYSIIIAFCMYREKWAKNKASRIYAAQGGLSKPPEDLALHFGRLWREKARMSAQARASGRDVRLPDPIQEDAESFLLRMLGRVSVLNVGQSHDLRRCRHEAEILRRTSKAAAWLTRISTTIMLVLIAGLAYSISAVQFLQHPQYVNPME